MSKMYKNVDENFAKSCSILTIFSKRKGFFHILVDELQEIAKNDDWLETVLGKQKTESDRIRVILENKCLMNCIEDTMSRVEPLYWKKSLKICKQRIERCVLSVKNGDLDMALGHANQAVIFAGVPSKDAENDYSLVASLWMRAEVLLKRGQYELALRDLKLALKNGMNAKMRGEYYWRLGDAYKGMKHLAGARTSYNIALKLFENKNKEAIKEIEEALRSLKDLPSVPPPKPKGVFDTEIKVTLGQRENMPALSKLVKVVEKENMGRFTVADKPVKAGAVVLVEEPYASCLDPELLGTHCLHCFKRVEAPLACPGCAGAAFCDMECQEKAVSSYHKYECFFENFFYGSGMSILSRLALRMVTQIGIESCRAIHAEYLASDKKTINAALVNDIEGNVKSKIRRSRQDRINRNRRDETGKVFFEKPQEGESSRSSPDAAASDYAEVITAASGIYSLCIHADAREPDDLLNRFVMAMFLKECLLKSGFFDTSNKEILKKDERIILELLVRNLELLQFNAHQLYEVLRAPNASKLNYTAVGIYPTASLFNHECYPTVARFFSGKNIVLRATRPIPAGGIVAEHYGPHFLTYCLEDRKRELASRYWFACTCLACQEDWPLLAKMKQEDTPPIRCPTAGCTNSFVGSMQTMPVVCAKCNHQLPTQVLKRSIKVAKEAIKNFEEAASLVDKEKVDEAILKFTNGVNMYHTVGAVPFKATHIAEEALRACYSRYGNTHMVAEMPKAEDDEDDEGLTTNPAAVAYRELAEESKKASDAASDNILLSCCESHNHKQK